MTTLHVAHGIMNLSSGRARVDGFAFFHVTFEPAEDALPSVGVAGGLGGNAGEAFLADSYQRARARFLRTAGMQSVDGGGLQFPADDRLEAAAVAAGPGMDQQAWRIDLQIFAFDVKGRAIGAHA